jgi:hypothetical protein
MLSNFDLNHLLTFSVKDTNARKQFMIGALVYLLAFIIPILPILVITGYMVRIVRQVLRNEKPHMEPWENWQEMFLDGLMLITQFAMMTLVLICLLPLMIPVISMYMMLVTFTAYAMAYKSGTEQLANEPATVLI